MELQFLDLDGCSVDDIQSLTSILSLQDEHKTKKDDKITIEDDQNSKQQVPEQGYNQQVHGNYQNAPGYPSVYINNVTANVNVHADAPRNGPVNHPPPPLPPNVPQQQSIPIHPQQVVAPPHLHHPQQLMTPPNSASLDGYVCQIPQFLISSYNLSLSLPHGPFHPVPVATPQHMHRQPLTVIRNPGHPPNGVPFSIQLDNPFMNPSGPPPPAPSFKIPRVQRPPIIPSHQIHPTAPPIVRPEVITSEISHDKKPAVEFVDEQQRPIEKEKPPVAVVAEVKQPVRKEEVVLDLTKKSPKIEEEEECPSNSKKSWASLFRTNDEAASKGVEADETVDKSALKPMARIMPFSGISSPECGNSSKTVSSSEIESNTALAFFLKQYVLNHKSPSVKPRGLTNRSNWCFVNAILQALVGCPPFFNLFRSLPPALLEEQSILKSLYDFAAEFSPMEKFPKVHHRRNKKTEDLMVGNPFEASSIYRTLLSLKFRDTFSVVEGRQEDAEEFLTFLLNGVNDEMLAQLKKIDEDNGENENINNADDNGDDWKEVGPKNKSTYTRRQVLGSSPLASMVQGQIRSCVTRSGSEPTATLQPFFTLQLDIQSENIRSVSDALASSFSMESLDGYLCSKTKLEIEASRSLAIDELPPILILHLKRFIYDETSGGCQKLLKLVDFSVDLEITKEILSPNSRSKYSPKQRQYKLFAVVYHNGVEATKGHYVTDVYHTGLSSWLRCDDCQVRSVTEAQVMAHTHNSLPYILFYRRGDTMVGLDKTKVASS